MALLFCDSFDANDTYGGVLAKWGGGGNVFINPSTSYGRNGTRGMIIENGRYFALDATRFGGAKTTVIFGAALYWTVYSNYFLEFYDDTGGDHQVTLVMNSDYSISAYRGRGTTLLGTSAPGVVTTGRFYYLEVKLTVDDTAGVVLVKLDGTTILNLTAQDTKKTANATFSRIFLGDAGGSFNEYLFIDDVYLIDTTGSSPTNDFLGDVRVEALFPNGNGNSSQLVGQDADSTNNYLNVDETTDPDGDTTYNESATVGQKDTYAYTNLTPTSGTVYGVQVLPYARKTDAGVRKIVSVARLSTTEVDSAEKTLATSYAWYPDIREAKPGGGVWTISDVNSAEFGVKVST